MELSSGLEPHAIEQDFWQLARQKIATMIATHRGKQWEAANA